MDKLKVAIVDDGVYKSSVPQYLVTDEHRVVQVSDRRCILNHATQCYNIYSSVADNKECVSIKVGDYDSTGKLSSNKLITALEWCCHNGIDLISLSLGTSYVNEFRRYEKVMDELIEKNIIVVAAINNNNRLTFPASRDGIIGVRFDKEYKLPSGKYEYLENELTGTNIVVNPLMREAGSRNTSIEPHNSFAVPYIAALISNELSKNNSINNSLKRDVGSWIRKNAHTITDKFSTDYYISLLKNKEFDPPINICILSKDKKVSGLGGLFNKNQYTAVELEINDLIEWKLINRSASKDDFRYIYKIIYGLALPDIIIWYADYNFINDSMTDFFNAVILKENNNVNSDFKRLLCRDGIVLKYGDEDFCKEVLFNNICNTFS